MLSHGGWHSKRRSRDAACLLLFSLCPVALVLSGTHQLRQGGAFPQAGIPASAGPLPGHRWTRAPHALDDYRVTSLIRNSPLPHRLGRLAVELRLRGGRGKEAVDKVEEEGEDSDMEGKDTSSLERR